MTPVSNRSSPVISVNSVIPAKAGIQVVSGQFLDARLRGHDDAVSEDVVLPSKFSVTLLLLGFPTL